MARESTQPVSRSRSRQRGAAPAILQIAIAVPDADTAARISAALLEAQLCACVQTVGPVTSRYRWQGAIETAAEFLLLVKTRPNLYRAVETMVCALHPYELPEIIAMPVQNALAGYAHWVVESTAPPAPPPVPKTRSRRGR